ncbi:type II secretion system F family protein [Actinorugispora endophytica]|uniref:Type II secretion system (T2SS) protein F n=1 Tax=Actinorugispora endophytica TaxID=1605990 RepID=A0A4R6V7W6_9ACTN|nr:type II secretion system F family protein [Actinorugispora endophytica]TDQ55352.1 type II secretion system (T2SS) protein F [Actinorugispora endophytica]
MDLFEAALVGMAALAGALLAGDGRSVAEHRLAALSPKPRRPSRRQPRRVPVGLRVLVACAPLGTACLLLGAPIGLPAGLAAGALVWWRLGRGDPAAARGRAAESAMALPLAVDLLVAGLRSGSDPIGVVAAVARAVGGPLGTELGEVAHRLRLGADPAEAWRELRGPAELVTLGKAIARASRTGAPLADVLELHAADCRRAARVRALALSQRVGVAVAAPLGLCFLPAFALIGVVPLAAGLVSDLVLS